MLTVSVSFFFHTGIFLNLIVNLPEPQHEKTMVVTTRRVKQISLAYLGNRSFRYKVVSIQSRFDTSRFDTNSSGEIAQKFDYFKEILQLNKKNILGEILRSLSEVRETTYTSKE